MSSDGLPDTMGLDIEMAVEQDTDVEMIDAGLSDSEEHMDIDGQSPYTHQFISMCQLERKVAVENADDAQGSENTVTGAQDVAGEPTVAMQAGNLVLVHLDCLPLGLAVM
ncbi:hypothetical protein EVG20_g11519 [Dentipellis fragilis]|uniref:Uncharacterized protein n=1 Tax=Dentipellis fragilis TaxID=205917 RepID=A0A4Y9XKD2_9AGAM|nr:hypothetical protein EVG20_g11519 [Dentipellis fragilis]